MAIPGPGPDRVQQRGTLVDERRSTMMLTLLAGLTAAMMLLGNPVGGRLWFGVPGSDSPLEAAMTSFPQFAPSPAAQLAKPVLSGGIVAVDLHVQSATERAAHHALAEFLAKKYRVSEEMMVKLIATAYEAGHRIGLDPLLIIAMMAIESRFNPFAESHAGAKGLMQVIPKFHADKLPALDTGKTVFDPEVNIVAGAKILKEYIGRTGNLTDALQMYAGAANDGQDRYATKVMGEKRRLQKVLHSETVRAVQEDADQQPLG
jgi:soluble lytic murein transglycosylase-like protein